MTAGVPTPDPPSLSDPDPTAEDIAAVREALPSPHQPDNGECFCVDCSWKRQALAALDRLAERIAATEAERDSSREWVKRIFATTEQEMWDERNGPDAWALSLKREYRSQLTASEARSAKLEAALRMLWTYYLLPISDEQKTQVEAALDPSPAAEEEQ